MYSKALYLSLLLASTGAFAADTYGEIPAPEDESTTTVSPPIPQGTGTGGKPYVPGGPENAYGEGYVGNGPTAPVGLPATTIIPPPMGTGDVLPYNPNPYPSGYGPVTTSLGSIPSNVPGEGPKTWNNCVGLEAAGYTVTCKSATVVAQPTGVAQPSSGYGDYRRKRHNNHHNDNEPKDKQPKNGEMNAYGGEHRYGNEHHSEAGPTGTVGEGDFSGRPVCYHFILAHFDEQGKPVDVV